MSPAGHGSRDNVQNLADELHGAPGLGQITAKVSVFQILQRFSFKSGQRRYRSETTILVKILGTSHKIALFQSLIQCPPLPPFQCWLNQTPFDHPNIELGGKGDEKVLNVCFHLDILGKMTKTQKFASVPIYFVQDCRTDTMLISLSHRRLCAFIVTEDVTIT